MKKETAIYQTICQLEIIRYKKGISQLEKVLAVALDIWTVNCNLSKDIYPVVAAEFNCKPNSIEKNLRNLLETISMRKLSKLTGRNIQGPITVKYFIEILIKHIQNTYVITN